MQCYSIRRRRPSGMCNELGQASAHSNMCNELKQLESNIVKQPQPRGQSKCNQAWPEPLPLQGAPWAITSLTARIAAASQRAARHGEQRGQAHSRAASRLRASTSERRIPGGVRAGALANATATGAAATSAT